MRLIKPNIQTYNTIKSQQITCQGVHYNVGIYHHGVRNWSIFCDHISKHNVLICVQCIYYILVEHTLQGLCSMVVYEFVDWQVYFLVFDEKYHFQLQNELVSFAYFYNIQVKLEDYEWVNPVVGYAKMLHHSE